MILRLKNWIRKRYRKSVSTRHSEEFARLNALKAEGQRAAGIDFARARIFLARAQPIAAIEALKEELRFFPGQPEAEALLDELLAGQTPPEIPGPEEFRELYAQIQPFTMVGVPRLHSLYELAKDVCLRDVPGNFVECGVAAGGTSALLAAVIKRYSKRPRQLFSCDTFEGMPEAGAEDVSFGVDAAQSGWGKGTCAAPVDSLREIARRLGAEEIVIPLAGLFSDTLPANRERIGEVAFLHMDGDWYSSTRDILVHLYDQIVPGGSIQIDDYGCWDGCRRAVAEFEKERALQFDLKRIDKTGVWMAKAREH